MNAKVIRFPTCADLRKTHAMATKTGWLSRLFGRPKRRASRASIVIYRAMRDRK